MQNASQQRGWGWRRAGKRPRRGSASARLPKGFLAGSGVSTHGCPPPLRTQPQDSPCLAAPCSGDIAGAWIPPGGCDRAVPQPCTWRGTSGSPRLRPHHHSTLPSSPQVLACPWSESILPAPAARPRLCHPRLAARGRHSRIRGCEAQLRGEAEEQTCKKKNVTAKGIFQGGEERLALSFVLCSFGDVSFSIPRDQKSRSQRKIKKSNPSVSPRSPASSCTSTPPCQPHPEAQLCPSRARCQQRSPRGRAVP